MAIKTYQPYTPSRRTMTIESRKELSKDRPEKSLVVGKQRTGGRNSSGHVTSRFIGGGHKKKYRTIDFKRDKTGIAARVASIEYDPNRSARIALLNYADGEKRYILAPAARATRERRPGNSSTLWMLVPTGMFFSGMQFPGLISASAPDWTFWPTRSPSGATMYRRSPSA